MKIDANQIESRLGILIRNERALLAEILKMIGLADQQKVYLDLGYASLFDWLTRHFLYSEGAAQRRIDAARALREVPELEQKIESGQVTLMALSRAQSAIRSEEKRTREKITTSAKFKIFEKLECKSTLEVERTLMAEFPEASIQQKEKVSVLNHGAVYLQLTLSMEDYQVLLRAKELMSHSNPGSDLGQIVGAVSRHYVQKNDPLLESGSSSTKGHAMIEEKNSDSSILQANDSNSKEKSTATVAVRIQKQRQVSVPVRRFIFQRDQGRCQYRDSVSGVVCGSRHQVEVDHVQPLSLGGSNDVQNLRCLCRAHNQRLAEKGGLGRSGILRRSESYR